MKQDCSYFCFLLKYLERLFDPIFFELLDGFIGS